MDSYLILCSVTGLSKKLEALGKRPSCSLVKRWSKIIVKHLYWCAVSSEGDGDLMVAKWNSVASHICNIHEGHSDLYPACSHGPLDGDLREWFVAGKSL